MLARFFGVVRGVEMMPMREMGMVPRLFMLAGAMMLGRETMMLGRLFVVGRGFVVMLGQFVRVHECPSIETANDLRASVSHAPRDTRPALR